VINKDRQHKSFFVPGENCWQVAPADKAAFLIDGEDYYRAVAEAFEQAQRSIYILGWDVDSRVRLCRDSDQGETLGQLIDRLAKAKPELQIYILEWDFAIFYSLEREFWSFFSFGWMSHERVYFELDDSHPAGASQHQKIVVVDDRLAFVGGFDLASFRWDTSDHRSEHPQRRDNGKAYGPVHDVQLLVNGRIARALGNLSRWRWERATGEVLPKIEATESVTAWPFSHSPDFFDQELAILRTLPAYAEDREVREVEQFYLQAIKRAEKYLYLENQYLSSQKIATALEESLRQEIGPEIVIVLPQRCPGWLEEETMGVLRKRLHQRLLDADQNDRLLICYPDRAGLEKDVIIVHSKLLVADDQLMTVGSANLSNRSMNFDSECNLALAADGDTERAESIAGLRDRLLAEHLNCSKQQVAEKLRETGSLLAVVKQLGSTERSLKELPLEGEQSEWQTLPGDLVADPEKPIGLDQLLDYLGVAVESDQKEKTYRRKGWFFILALLIALLLGGLWRWSPLNQWLSVANLLAAADYVRESSLAVPIVLGVYLLGSCLMFPINLLILATALSFGSITGFFLALGGSLLGGLGSYLLGRWLGRDAVLKLSGEKMNLLSRKLARRGWLTVALIRVVPIAPFTVVNMVAGASHISTRSFFIGTAIGMCPGILAIMIFEEGLERALRDPQWQTWGMAILALGVGVLVIAIAKRLLLKKSEHEHG
jgi:phosphatidylserine/phosphatidylglycerophosphate/cardiolipin synthase-like enzyme/uncharacterized membrane protein YdjX (TVP38/TMEM64 family)